MGGRKETPSEPAGPHRPAEAGHEDGGAPHGFVAEWRRRHMGRAAAAYVFAAFAIMGGAEVTVTAFDLPHWILSAAVIALALGFVGNLFFAWHFDVEVAEEGPRVRRVRRHRGAHRGIHKPTWATVAVLGLLAAGVGAWAFWPAPRPPPPPRLALVADLDDRTGEAAPRGTLEPVLEIAVQESPFLGVVDRAAARKGADRHRLGGMGLPVDRARAWAQRAGTHLVLASTLERKGDGYRLEVKALDPASGKVLASSSGSAPARDGVAALAARLVASVRGSLGVDAVATEGQGPPASPGAERVAARRRAEQLLGAGEDPAEAVELLVPIVARHPADAAALELLGRARIAQRDLTGAADATRRALTLEPASATLHAQAGRIALVTGDLEGALREYRRAGDLDGDLAEAYVGMALAQLLGGQRDAALASWEGLARRGPEAASVSSEGLADLAAYEGRLGDARAILEEGIAADQARGDVERNGHKLAMLAEVLLAEGQPGRAALTAERARRTSGTVHLQCMAGRVLAEAGDLRGPEAVVYDLAARSSPVAIACAELVLALQQVHRHAYADAVELASAARRRVDAWGTRAVLGRTYQEAGAMTQAHDELESCMTRRGEGAMAFLDGHPTARLLPPVMFRLGTVREALGDADSADIFREFVAVRKAAGDPLSAEATRRMSRSAAAHR